MHNMSENGNVQMTRRYEIIINSHDKIPKSDASKKRKKGNLIFKILIQNCFKALWHCTIKVVHMYLLIKLKVNLEVHLHRFFCNIFCDCAIQQAAILHLFFLFFRVERKDLNKVSEVLSLNFPSNIKRISVNYQKSSDNQNLISSVEFH